MAHGAFGCSDSKTRSQVARYFAHRRASSWLAGVTEQQVPERLRRA
jgi:hypothetical protein